MNDNHRFILGDKLKQSPFIEDKDYVFVPQKQPVGRIVLLFCAWIFIICLSAKTFNSGDYGLGALGICVSILIGTVAVYDGLNLK